MKLTKYFMPLVALGLLASCSNDADLKGPQEDIVDGLYLSMQILPNQTRTETGDASSKKTGEEEGTVLESTINRAYIVLVGTEGENNGKVITTATIGNTDLQNTGKAYIATGKVEREDVQGLAGKTVKVFVICNYPTGMAAPSSGADIQEVLNTTKYTADTQLAFIQKFSTDASSSQNFLMTNADQDNWTKPFTESDLATGAHSTPSTALPIGPINVQRAMARFDISKNNANTVFKLDNEVNDPLTVTMVGAALVNVSKSFNLFKELAAASTIATTPSWEFFASEWDNSASDYDYTRVVRDPESATKVLLVAESGTTSTFSNSFFSPIFNGDRKQIDPKSVASYTAYTSLTNNGKTPTGPELPGDYDNDLSWAWSDYGVLGYCTPNTIHKVADMQRGITTGVVFKAKITGGKFTSGTGNIYVYGETVYGSFDELKTYVKDEGKTNSGNDDYFGVSTAFNTALAALTDKTKTIDNVEETDIKAKLVENKFTIYDKDNDGYYCYYYYMNRHNDNVLSGTTGVMEFGVVRNNVYKLAVTGVSRLGHPGTTENDPDPEDPNDPDEPKDFYMSVQVDVLPWTVRINNIEF